MATLTAWAYPGAGDAEQAVERLKALQAQKLVTIQDAAIVSWAEGAKKPKTRQLNNMAGAGALGGAFWGMLFGLLFFVPCSAWPSGRRRGRDGSMPTSASTTTSSTA